MIRGLMVCLLVVTGCASAPERRVLLSPSAVRIPGAFAVLGARAPLNNVVLGAAAPDEPCPALVRAAGFEPEAVSCPDPLTPAYASYIRWRLLTSPTPTPLASFGPRLVLSRLVREVEAGGVPVSRAAVTERLARFRRLAVLRPDGYLASALSGRTLQRALRSLEVRDGTLKAARFELGRFYTMAGGVYREVNDRLECTDPTPLDDVRDDADVISRTLDGAQDAMLGLALALGHLVTHPIQSLAGLQNLPQALMGLIENSPAYFERFRLMTRGEQIQALAKLATTIILTTGSAGGTTTELTAAGSELGAVSVPALSLAADGTLALRHVAVPVGQLATALGGGPGAVYVLHMANQAAQGGEAGRKWTPPAGGPGKWVEKAESMELPARKYQHQVTGVPDGWVYRVENVKLPDGTMSATVDFDGFVDGVLLEAKGPGYESFLDETGEFWFKGAENMKSQAIRQVAAANGLPVRWVIAEPRVVEAIRELFRSAEIEGIELVYAPPLP